MHLGYGVKECQFPSADFLLREFCIRISDSPFDIDTKLIDKTMINTKPICGMNESEKKEQKIKSEAREINMQSIWLIGKYLKALLTLLFKFCHSVTILFGT